MPIRGRPVLLTARSVVVAFLDSETTRNVEMPLLGEMVLAVVAPSGAVVRGNDRGQGG
jgi:hypothetical protein